MRLYFIIDVFPGCFLFKIAFSNHASESGIDFSSCQFFKNSRFVVFRAFDKFCKLTLREHHSSAELVIVHANNFKYFFLYRAFVVFLKTSVKSAKGSGRLLKFSVRFLVISLNLPACLIFLAVIPDKY